MMKTSEPRTFSWISTKISMSAKRRTLDLVSDNCSASAISCASAGLELPATSLIEPFLADIDAFPGALVDRTFSIPDTHKTGAFRLRERDIKQAPERQEGAVGFPAQNPDRQRSFSLFSGPCSGARCREGRRQGSRYRQSPAPGRAPAAGRRAQRAPFR